MGWLFLVLSGCVEPAEELAGVYQLEPSQTESGCGLESEQLVLDGQWLEVETLSRGDLLVQTESWANVFVPKAERWEASRLSRHDWVECEQRVTTEWSLVPTELGALRLVESIGFEVQGSCAPSGQWCEVRTEHLAWPTP